MSGCVCVFALVFWSVVRSSRTVHVLPGVRLPNSRHRHVGGGAGWWRRCVEDVVAGRVLHRPRASSVTGRCRRTAAHLGDERRSSRPETGQRQALLPAGAHACRPPALPRTGHSLAPSKSISQSFIMRPSSLGGGRILRRTLSVRLSVSPSVPCLFTLEHRSRVFVNLADVRYLLFCLHFRAAYRTAISAAQACWVSNI